MAPLPRRLVATLACRNGGSRLYGKPMQNLGQNASGQSIPVLEHILSVLRGLGCIDDIVLGISEGVENVAYGDFAKAHGIKAITGDQKDVLSRLIQCGRAGEATDVFRVTTESPFLYFEPVLEAWKKHVEGDFDATFMDHAPDGCGFEIMKLSALERSHRDGTSKHRSEFCTLFIRENPSLFKTQFLEVPKELVRKDIRLTVDYPEDLIVCREAYRHFQAKAPMISVSEIVRWLDTRPDLKALTAPYCEAGYATMYVRSPQP